MAEGGSVPALPGAAHLAPAGGHTWGVFFIRKGAGGGAGALLGSWGSKPGGVGVRPSVWGAAISEVLPGGRACSTPGRWARAAGWELSRPGPVSARGRLRPRLPQFPLPAPPLPAPSPARGGAAGGACSSLTPGGRYRPRPLQRGGKLRHGGCPRLHEPGRGREGGRSPPPEPC